METSALLIEATPELKFPSHIVSCISCQRQIKLRRYQGNWQQYRCADCRAK